GLFARRQKQPSQLAGLVAPPSDILLQPAQLRPAEEVRSMAAVTIPLRRRILQPDDSTPLSGFGDHPAFDPLLGVVPFFQNSASQPFPLPCDGFMGNIDQRRIRVGGDQKSLARKSLDDRP